jgi:hypothetical protein
LLPFTYIRDGYRIRELTSQTALQQKGHRLGHCVGTYVVPCLVGGTFIYSVRDRLVQSLSTFEVTLSGAGPSLVQHKARLNTPTPESDLHPAEARREGIPTLLARHGKAVLTELPRALQ